MSNYSNLPSIARNQATVLTQIEFHRAEIASNCGPLDYSLWRIVRSIFFTKTCEIDEMPPQTVVHCDPHTRASVLMVELLVNSTYILIKITFYSGLMKSRAGENF
jgi:hypothetical protein